MSKFISIDDENFRDFFQRLGKAASGDFKRELALFLEGLGYEFLRIVQDEIIRKKVMNTRLLLASFHRGGADNVWVLDAGGLSLEVGTNVKYAKWVNDGHFQEPGRFIPGRWKGDQFIYDPGADTGMVLKASFVEGKKYWDSALYAIEKMFPDLLDAKVQQWLDRYFSDFV